MAILQGIIKKEKIKAPDFNINAEAIDRGTLRQNALNDYLQQQKSKKQGGGFLGGLIRGITDPFARVAESAFALQGSGVPDMSVQSQKDFRADPTRFALQRGADVGSIASMLVPGSTLARSAVAGGLAGFGGAQEGEDPLTQGLIGAGLGAGAHGLLSGISKIAGKGAGAVGRAEEKLLAKESQMVQPIVGKGAKTINASSEAGKKLVSIYEKYGKKVTADPVLNYSNGNEIIDTLSTKLKGKLAKVGVTSTQKEGLISEIESALKTKVDITKGDGKGILDQIKTRINGAGSAADLWDARVAFDTQAFKGGAGVSTNMSKTASSEARKGLAGFLAKQKGFSSTMDELAPLLTGTSGKAGGKGAILDAIMGQKRTKIFLPVLGGVPVGGAVDKFGMGLAKTGVKIAKAKEAIAPKIGGIADFLKGQVPRGLPALMNMPQGQQQDTQGTEQQVDPMQEQVNYQQYLNQTAMELLQRNPKMTPTNAKKIAEMYLGSQGISAPSSTKVTAKEQQIQKSGDIAKSALSILERTPSAAGKVASVGTGISSFFGGGNEDAIAYRQALAGANTLLKNAYLGGAITPTEYKGLKDALPQPTDEARVAKIKLRGFIDIFSGYGSGGNTADQLQSILDNNQ